MKKQNETPRKALGLSSNHETQWGAWVGMRDHGLDLDGIPGISWDPLEFDELIIKS